MTQNVTYPCPLEILPQLLINQHLQFIVSTWWIVIRLDKLHTYRLSKQQIRQPLLENRSQSMSQIVWILTKVLEFETSWFDFLLHRCNLMHGMSVQLVEPLPHSARDRVQPWHYLCGVCTFTLWPRVFIPHSKRTWVGRLTERHKFPPACRSVVEFWGSLVLFSV